MSTIELLKKVRKIEIKTKGLSNHIFSGEYHTAYKGKGMAFSEVREYQPGDEVRSIDWNVTARYNNPFVKVDKWMDAKFIIKSWGNDEIKKRQKECKSWWSSHKLNLQEMVRSKINQ